jgi:hypothetical protein
MTTEQIDICKWFNNIRFLPGGFDKRFATNLVNLAYKDPDKEITKKQNEWIYRILYKYRKQIPAIYNKYKDSEFCNRIKTLKQKMDEAKEVEIIKIDNLQLKLWD